MWKRGVIYIFHTRLLYICGREIHYPLPEPPVIAVNKKMMSLKNFLVAVLRRLMRRIKFVVGLDSIYIFMYVYLGEIFCYDVCILHST